MTARTTPALGTCGVLPAAASALAWPGLLLLAALAWLGGTGQAGAAGAPPPGLPFVGCPADGMMGPVEPPVAPAGVPAVKAAASARLAYYASEGLGVVAPRGWHCIGLYGSSGSLLLVTPDARSADDLFRPGWPVLGPAVLLVVTHGDTSGRFEVAKVVARLFPVRRAFVRAVVAEGFEPASAFPSGPYPADRVRRRGPDEVDFVTPPGRTAGMGTASRLGPDRDPIQGFARMLPADDLLTLRVRLPPGLRDLVPEIVRVARRSWRH